MSTMQQRAVFVNVVGWIFVALSSLGTATSLLQNVLYRTTFRSDELTAALQTPPPGVPAPAAFVFAHFQAVLVASLAVSVLTLTSSIGLLRRWDWARRVFVGLMALAVPWEAFGVVLQFSAFSTMRAQFAAASMQGGPFFVAVAVAGVVFALAFGALFAWIAMKLLSAPIAAEFRRRAAH